MHPRGAKIPPPGAKASASLTRAANDWQARPHFSAKTVPSSPLSKNKFISASWNADLAHAFQLPKLTRARSATQYLACTNVNGWSYGAVSTSTHPSVSYPGTKGSTSPDASSSRTSHCSRGPVRYNSTSGAASSKALAPAMRSLIGGRRSHEKCELSKRRTRTPRRLARASALTSGT